MCVCAISLMIFIPRAFKTCFIPVIWLALCVSCEKMVSLVAVAPLKWSRILWLLREFHIYARDFRKHLHEK